MEADVADIRERIVGQRYFNRGIDEAFTVVGVSNDGAMLFLQYDDGTAWDEIATPNLLTEDVAKQLGVNEGGIGEEHYVPLGHGPTLTHTCREEDHERFPFPADLGWETAGEYHANANVYSRLIRCKKCGLSGDGLGQFEGHRYPELCGRCDALINGGDDASYGSTPDWQGETLCASCTETVVEADAETVVTCFKCGTDASETDSGRDSYHRVPESSSLGQVHRSQCHE